MGWDEVPEPLEISRDDPNEAIINGTIEGNTAEKSFRAYANKNQAVISLSVSPEVTSTLHDQVTLMKGATRTIDLIVEDEGEYTITATAVLSGESKSVNWRWTLRNTCSYAYLADGGIWIHVCAMEADNAPMAGQIAGAAIFISEILGATVAAQIGAALILLFGPIWLFCRDEEGYVDVFIDPESYIALQAYVPGGAGLEIAAIILQTRYLMTVGGE